MSVARVTEISAGSPVSFEEAVSIGIDRAVKTLQNVKSAWVKDQEVVVKDDAVTEYRVHLKVTFILTE